MNNIKLQNSLNLKFFCEIKHDNYKIDVTDCVYKKCLYFDSYIYIIKSNIQKLLLFEDLGLYYYDGIKYNIIILDSDELYNINDDENILIDMNYNKLYFNKTFMYIDNKLTNIINNDSKFKNETYSVCFVITLKYIRGYDSYIKIYVDNIQKFYKNSFIIIVDNNSIHLKDIEIIFTYYKNIVIITNNSDNKFELGGHLFGLKWLMINNYTDFDYYIFTQDTLIIQNKYDFNKLKYLNIQSCSIVEHQEHFEWIFSNEKRNILKKYNIVCSNTNICWGCNYIVHKNKLNTLLEYIKDFSLKTKDDSCMSERIMGFFIKELEPKNFNVDGFLNECESKNFKYFIKISQAKTENNIESINIPILKNNIITVKEKT